MVIRRVLKINKFYYRTARKKLFVNNNIKLKRIEFANKYQNQHFYCLENVLFSDETKINIFGSYDDCKICRKKESLSLPTFQQTVKYSSGVYDAKGCFTAVKARKIAFIDGIMNLKTIWIF